MPGPLTHLRFAETVIQPYRTTFSFLQAYEPLYHVGSLGPDPFFFYKSVEFNSEAKRLGRAFGSTLHLQDPLKTFKPLFDVVQHSFQEKNAFMAYLMGFVTHYVLDRIMHPFVFYFSGFDEQGGIKAMPYQADHIRLEHSLDLAFLERDGLTIQAYNPTNVFPLDVHQRLLIANLYAQAFHIPMAYFHDSFSTMQALYHLVYDPGRWKRPLIKLAFQKRSFIYALTHDVELQPSKRDLVTNANKKTWVHPSLLTVHNTSAYDLFENAIHAMDPYFAQLYQLMYQQDFTFDTFAMLLSNVNFDGDIVGSTKRVFQSIYPTYKKQPEARQESVHVNE